MIIVYLTIILGGIWGYFRLKAENKRYAELEQACLSEPDSTTRQLKLTKLSQWRRCSILRRPELERDILA